LRLRAEPPASSVLPALVTHFRHGAAASRFNFRSAIGNPLFSCKSGRFRLRVLNSHAKTSWNSSKTSKLDYIWKCLRTLRVRSTQITPRKTIGNMVACLPTTNCAISQCIIEINCMQYDTLSMVWQKSQQRCRWYQTCAGAK